MSSSLREYAADPATAAYTTGSYSNIKVEKVDDHTVKVIFKEPRTPFWADPFVGVVGQILPKHHFGEYKGAKSREAPGNLKPVGTGPYKFVDFKPGDILTGRAHRGLPRQEPAAFRPRSRSRAAAMPSRRPAPCSRTGELDLCPEPAGRRRDP